MQSWTEFSIAASLPNSPTASWTVWIGVGTNLVHQVGTGLGTFIRTGPFILSPRESIAIVITGGAANDNLIGSLYGVQNLDPIQLYAAPATGTQVSIAGGTVNATITQPLGVGITGANSVVIGNTPAVTVNSGTVNIGNTPSVTISGTPTVILGAGTANVGTIQAINSTVTVGGTVNIGNTPSVTISGTPNVNIASGTVNIGNTPNITITGQTINLNALVRTDLGVTLTATSASGQPNINVPDSTQFGVGNLILILNMPSLTSQLATVIAINNATQIKIAGNLQNNLAIGDAIKKVSEVALNGVNINNGILDVNDIYAGYDASGSSAPATGSAPSVVLAATGGKAYTCATYSGDMSQTGATADAGEALQLQDGGGTVLTHRLGVFVNAGNTTSINRQRVAFRGGVGNSMTMAFAGMGASTIASVSIGAYLK